MTAKQPTIPSDGPRSASAPVPAPTSATKTTTTPARARSLPEPIVRPPAPAPAPMPDATSIGRTARAGAGQEASDTHASGARPELLATIRTLGGILDDLERVRIMSTNRVAAQEREYGSAVPHLDVILAPIKAAEHQAELELIRAWRKHPLAPWAKSIKGVGEKSIARLISHVGDPGERPNPAKLWAYCGLGDPARKRFKGMTQAEAFALGNPAAKKQCWLIGEAFVKTRSGPYRAVYDAAREQYADREHATTCVRCGPAGKPAPAGSPWSLKHQHEAAKRKAVKTFLKHMWIASRPRATDAHGSSAGGDDL